MLGFVRTDNEALVSCLGDPQRAVAAYRELLRRTEDAVGASTWRRQHNAAGVRANCDLVSRERGSLTGLAVWE
jgi:hypothetical protein